MENVRNNSKRTQNEITRRTTEERTLRLDSSASADFLNDFLRESWRVADGRKDIRSSSSSLSSSDFILIELCCLSFLQRKVSAGENRGGKQRGKRRWSLGCENSKTKRALATTQKKTKTKNGNSLSFFVLRAFILP